MTAHIVAINDERKTYTAYLGSDLAPGWRKSRTPVDMFELAKHGYRWVFHTDAGQVGK